MADRQGLSLFSDWRQEAFDRFAFVLTRVPGVEAAWVSGSAASGTPVWNSVLRLGCLMKEDDHPYRDAGSFWYQGLTVRLRFSGLAALRQRLFKLRPDWDLVAGSVADWRIVMDSQGRLRQLVDEVRDYPRPRRLVCTLHHASRFVLSLEALDSRDSLELLRSALVSAGKAALAACGVPQPPHGRWIATLGDLAQSDRLSRELPETADQVMQLLDLVQSGLPDAARSRVDAMEALAGLHIALLEWIRTRLREYCGDRFTLDDCLLSRPELGVVQVELENILQRLCKRAHTLSPEAIPELGFRMPRVEYSLDVPADAEAEKGVDLST